MPLRLLLTALVAGLLLAALAPPSDPAPKRLLAFERPIGFGYTVFDLDEGTMRRHIDLDEWLSQWEDGALRSYVADAGLYVPKGRYDSASGQTTMEVHEVDLLTAQAEVRYTFSTDFDPIRVAPSTGRYFGVMDQDGEPADDPLRVVHGHVDEPVPTTSWRLETEEHPYTFQVTRRTPDSLRSLSQRLEPIETHLAPDGRFLLTVNRYMNTEKADGGHGASTRLAPASDDRIHEPELSWYVLIGFSEDAAEPVFVQRAYPNVPAVVFSADSRYVCYANQIGYDQGTSMLCRDRDHGYQFASIPIGPFDANLSDVDLIEVGDDGLVASHAYRVFRDQPLTHFFRVDTTGTRTAFVSHPFAVKTTLPFDDDHYLAVEFPREGAVPVHYLDRATLRLDRTDTLRYDPDINLFSGAIRLLAAR
ncbi:MAG: hypothetical protein AAF970_01710 [Bacteroidota bacterium]